VDFYLFGLKNRIENNRSSSLFSETVVKFAQYFVGPHTYISFSNSRLDWDTSVDHIEVHVVLLIRPFSMHHPPKTHNHNNQAKNKSRYISAQTQIAVYFLLFLL
jgi:hypothetical protein